MRAFGTKTAKWLAAAALTMTAACAEAQDAKEAKAQDAKAATEQQAAQPAQEKTAPALAAMRYIQFEFPINLFHKSSEQLATIDPQRRKPKEIFDSLIAQYNSSKAGMTVMDTAIKAFNTLPEDLKGELIKNQGERDKKKELLAKQAMTEAFMMKANEKADLSLAIHSVKEQAIGMRFDPSIKYGSWPGVAPENIQDLKDGLALEFIKGLALAIGKEIAKQTGRTEKETLEAFMANYKTSKNSKVVASFVWNFYNGLQDNVKMELTKPADKQNPKVAAYIKESILSRYKDDQNCQTATIALISETMSAQKQQMPASVK